MRTLFHLISLAIVSAAVVQRDGLFGEDQPQMEVEGGGLATDVPIPNDPIPHEPIPNDTPETIVAPPVPSPAPAPTPTSTPAPPSSSPSPSPSQAPTSRVSAVVPPPGTPVATSEWLLAASASPIAPLSPWPTVPIAKSIGLLMPNPYRPIYAGVPYMFGFVEPGPRPAQIAGGWLRDITAFLQMPDDSFSVFGSVGNLDPKNKSATPVAGDPLCGALTVYNWAYSYPFTFEKEGWYQFAINETWLQPTIEFNRCMMPIAQERSFFATASFSVSPQPTNGAVPSTLTEAYTVWAAVGTTTPSPLPSSRGSNDKIVAAVGISMGVLALIICLLIWFWCRKRITAQREVVAFSRLRPQDKQEFLSSNPEAPFNPMRPAKRHYWALLCLPEPPGTAPAKIPKKKKFVPPAYAGPKSLSAHRPQHTRGPSLAVPVAYYHAPARGAPSAYGPPSMAQSVQPVPSSYGEPEYRAQYALPSSYGHYAHASLQDASPLQEPGRGGTFQSGRNMEPPRPPPKEYGRV